MELQISHSVCAKVSKEGILQSKKGDNGKKPETVEGVERPAIKSQEKKEKNEKEKIAREWKQKKGPPRASQESVGKSLDGVLNDIEQMQRSQMIESEKFS